MMLKRHWSLLLVVALFGLVENASAEDSEPAIVQLKVGATKCSLSTWRSIAENFAERHIESDPVLSKALALEWGELEKKCERLDPDESHTVVLTGRSVSLQPIGEVFEIEDGRYVWDDDIED